MSTRSGSSRRPRDHAVGEEDVWRWAIAISDALTQSEVAIALAGAGAAAAGATGADLAVVDTETDRVQFVHTGALDPKIAARWATIDARAKIPAQEVILTGEPVLLSSPEAIRSRYPHLSSAMSRASVCATASLPLRTADGVILGAVGFGWGEPQPFEPTQVGRLYLIAQMAAHALDRALRYDQDRGPASSRERTQARLLQDAFLPRVLPDTANIELAAAYVPARDASMGGDWYDVFAVDGGICLVIGDVAGHGLQAAAMMVQLRNATRAFASEDPAPDRVLTRLNGMMWRLEPGETATAIVAVWHPDERTIVRSSAGHPPVLRCREGETGYLSPAGPGVMLGAAANSEYVAEAKVLRPGTTLLLYTDGLIETRGKTLDDGMNDLQKFVERLTDLSPQAVCDQVLEWRLGAPRREDLCLLATRLS